MSDRESTVLAAGTSHTGDFLESEKGFCRKQKCYIGVREEEGWQERGNWKGFWFLGKRKKENLAIDINFCSTFYYLLPLRSLSQHKVKKLLQTW